ncbi:MAG TPA: cytochrome d ubiquinol oxidase subunit II [Elusimicrobiota bacterium]|nr:cytochrome d ubiquinol oxidase subunit II [Elusimicrobiota bacterium]
MDLNLVWYLLLGALFTGYVLLDGYDFGVGALHLFSEGEEERRTLMNAVGPVWDGNEVWLVAGGGALFAAFPAVYAAVFSGFYPAVMLLLFALIARAVALEFRGKLPAARWKKFWDAAFFAGSALAPFLLGVAAGNLALGLPLNAAGEFAAGVPFLLRPYALLIGALALSLSTLHGALYLLLKTDGPLRQKAHRWARKAFLLFLVLYVLATASTLLFVPRFVAPLLEHPALWLVPLVTITALAVLFRALRRDRPLIALLASGTVIAGLMALFGLGLFPHLVHSVPSPENSLTVYNAASSPKTLAIMLRIAALGLPPALAYTVVVHWIFRGKVKLDPSGY